MKKGALRGFLGACDQATTRARQNHNKLKPRSAFYFIKWVVDAPANGDRIMLAVKSRQ